MIKTTFKINIENIVVQLDQIKCQNIVTPQRLSYMASQILLEGDPNSPRGQPLLSQVTQWCPLGEPRLPYMRIGVPYRRV